MKTRAAVAVAAGKPLEVMEVDLEGPRQGEVLVEIMATGICHTDEFTLSGADPEGMFPAILGRGSPVLANTPQYLPIPPQYPPKTATNTLPMPPKCTSKSTAPYRRTAVGAPAVPAPRAGGGNGGGFL